MLPQVDLTQADLIVLLATATDLGDAVPLEKFDANLRMLLRALPPEKSVFSDFPIEPGQGAYQAILQQAADERGNSGVLIFPKYFLAKDAAWISSRGYCLT